MKLSGNIPFNPVLSMAQALLEQLKGDEYCPYELRVCLMMQRIYMIRIAIVTK